MVRSLPPLNALRAFEAAGRHESFTKAAQELSVNHSSISRHVRGLEDRLGAQLFRDLPRGVALTAAGRVYLEEVSAALDRIAEATQVFAERPNGVVTVDAEPLFATQWLIPRLGAFYEQHPEIELRLTAQEALADVARYEADIALRFFKSDDDGLSYALISNAALFPFGAPQVFGGKIDDPAKLLSHDLYRDRDGPMWQAWFMAAGGDPSVVPEQPWRMRASLALEAAAAGHGAILTSADVADRSVAEGRLMRLSDVSIRRGSYRLIVGAEAQRRKPVRLFRDWLLEVTTPLRANT